MRSLSKYIPPIIILTLTSIFLFDCSKNEAPVKFPTGIFPDTVLNLEGLNSSFDDYNSTTNEITGSLPLIFSSNRKSSGQQFDLEQGLITFKFNKSDGTFSFNTSMTHDEFLTKLITTSETAGNDFGPYRTFSTDDGLEYLILASENSEGNLDLTYCKNLPPYGTILPDVSGPFPIKLLNSSYDDAYLCFNLRLDTAYFTSNPEGNFDIWLKARPSGKNIDQWFDSDYSTALKVDSINSSGDDKCPMVYNQLMVFTSNRPGGYGGYDLYYSLFKNGNWNSPVNFGAKINTSYDEYRPLIGYHTDFSNIFMIFSSNRPGGLGGFDLYFTGIEFPSK
jgi:hypothetical protein